MLGPRLSDRSCAAAAMSPSPTREELKQEPPSVKIVAPEAEVHFALRFDSSASRSV